MRRRYKCNMFCSGLSETAPTRAYSVAGCSTAAGLAC